MKMMESREDAIDFPCSEGYATHYASLGLTRDFPPEFYRNLPELRGDKLERELGEREAKSKFKGPYPPIHSAPKKPLVRPVVKQPRKGFRA